MNSSLYIGATGMKGLAEGMQVTTNNIANISTIGFKQQDILFSDVLYQTQASMGNWWNAQDDSKVAIGQVGMGLQVEAVRTRYTQGPIESTNIMTDMAINGKGFFQVTDGENMYYTRAGDFNSDKDGVWRTPSGLALTGYKLDASGNKSELSEIKIDSSEPMAAKATTGVNLTLNFSPTQDLTVNAENPYFALLGQYNASNETPLDPSSYSTSQTMTFYDADGNAQQVTAYFDAAPSNGVNRVMEFLIASPGDMLDADGNPRQAGDGLLMSGVLEFDEKGNLKNVAAFTPTVAGSQDLADWIPASLVDGNPALEINGSQVGMNFGLSAAGGWENAPENAAAIGTSAAGMPQMGEDAVLAEFPTTAYNTTAFVNSYKQDGYAEGTLSNISISANGTIVGQYSNGQIQDLWQIPVARFTSEDGLRREGGNLFSATVESGEMSLGMAGTENYGDIEAYALENSNVDLAQEMVNMIINQRGFQSNSKVVTTADLMLQKAMEIKRQ